MIPPEPDPPEPTKPEYTYAASSPVTLGAVTGTLYTNIQFNGSNCELTGSAGANFTHYKNIILYEVDGTPYCYFARGTSPIIGILGNNAEIGLSVNTYVIQNGTVTQGDTEYVEASVPSDYFEDIRTRNFTLTQRS